MLPAVTSVLFWHRTLIEIRVTSELPGHLKPKLSWQKWRKAVKAEGKRTQTFEDQVWKSLILKTLVIMVIKISSVLDCSVVWQGILVEGQAGKMYTLAAHLCLYMIFLKFIPITNLSHEIFNTKEEKEQHLCCQKREVN